ncbi:MAG: DUF4395 domain-containing protein [Bacteroidota bacterium]
MGKIIAFGETVDKYSVPVLNEREIRASAGILFLFAFISLMLILFRGEFITAKFFVIIFITDFVVRVLVNPKYSPSIILGRLIVRNQQPEYVGAPQKKFAWTIGLVLGGLMFFFLIVLNTYSIITGLICLICLIFLFFESVFGICLGCLFYNMIYKEKAKHCPGNSCDVNDRQEIQKISKPQLFLLLGFIAYIVLSIYVLTTTLSPKPQDLWVKLGMKQEVAADKK